MFQEGKIRWDLKFYIATMQGPKVLAKIADMFPPFPVINNDRSLIHNLA